MTLRSTLRAALSFKFQVMCVCILVEKFYNISTKIVIMSEKKYYIRTKCGNRFRFVPVLESELNMDDYGKIGKLINLTSFISNTNRLF